MISKATFDKYTNDPAAFRADLLVDVDGIVRRFGDVMDDWQHEDFAALDPALTRCAGRSTDAAIMRAWIERPRGHSKTTDLAIVGTWALAFATRPIKGYAFAADRDQARLLKDAMATIVRLNPWLGKILSVEAHRVINIANGHPGAGGTLSIEASDVGSSYGILPDLIIADEVTHWQGDGSLWHSLISSAAKRSNCLLVVITNAGFTTSWCWDVREAARTDEAWQFSALDGPQASWMTEARLAEQRRMLPQTAFERLWLNRWSSGLGDAIRPEDIEAAFDDSLQPLAPKERDYEFVAGLDLGVSRDASALCIVGIKKANPWAHDKSGHGKVRLGYLKLWKPAPDSKVDLGDVEQTVRDLHRSYNFKAIAFDPWQATYMSQRLALHKLPMVEITQTGSNLQRIATTVVEAFSDRRLALFEHPDLRRDLLRLRIEERSYGFRLVSPRDEHGHGDAASAFSFALLVASDVAGKFRKRVTAFDAMTPTSSVTERLARDWDSRQESYRREMEELSKWTHADESREEFLNAVRSNFPTSERFY